MKSASEPSTPIQSALCRLIGERAEAFRCERLPFDQGHEVFELESSGDDIVLRGSSQPALGFAFHHYLTHYAHRLFSHAGDGVRLPIPLPRIPTRVRCVSPYRYRYFLNYCTFSYTMAWWNWEQWKRELDWMALHGINLALAVVGEEAVWQAVLRRYGFDEQEIWRFLPGPAYLPWFLMGNLGGLGGPLSQAWIDRRVELQRRILARMRELGVEPVLHGFYGMVPGRLAEKRPSARIVAQGQWGCLDRPAILDPADPLFAEMAAAYYEEQACLVGLASFYGGDPFHEGGDVSHLDVTTAASAIQSAMQTARPGATWVLQGWQANPSDALLRGLDPRHTLVIDLFCETTPDWEKRDGFLGMPWIWGTVQNFGGNTPLYGKFAHIASESARALKSLNVPPPCGLGLLMEGIHANPVNHEFFFDLAWQPEMDLPAWLSAYACARYGRPEAHAETAWQILGQTVYAQPGITESLVCARPALALERVTTWGSARLYIDPARLEYAASLLLQAASTLGKEDAYRYDLVDVMRQALANRGQLYYRQAEAAFRDKRPAEFETACRQFLDLLDDMDELLATRREFLLGRWLAEARAAAPSDAERDLFERNARMLITTWSEHASDLHDYAYREWAGLLQSFYKPRWEIFFDALRAELSGRPRPAQDWFAWEWTWVQSRDHFPQEPRGDAIDIARRLQAKYQFNHPYIP